MNDFFCNSDDGARPELIYIQGYGFADPLKSPQRNLIRIYANALGYVLIAFLMLEKVAPTLLALFLRIFHPAIRIYNNRFLASREMIEVISGLSSLVCFLVPVLMLVTLLRIPRQAAFPLGRVPAGELVPAVGVVLGSSAIGASVSMMLSALLSLAGLYPTGPQAEPPASAGHLLLMVLSTALLPAVLEELLFRGVIMQSMRRFGDLFALCVTTLLFALLHRNFVQIPNAVITGMVLGFLVLRTGSLRTAMVCHFLNNLIPVLLTGISGSISEEAAGMAYLALNLLYLMAGVAGLVTLLLRRPQMFTALRGDGRRAERYKYGSFFSSPPILVVVILLLTLAILNMF